MTSSGVGKATDGVNARLATAFYDLLDHVANKKPVPSSPDEECLQDVARILTIMRERAGDKLLSSKVKRKAMVTLYEDLLRDKGRRPAGRRMMYYRFLVRQSSLERHTTLRLYEERKPIWELEAALEEYVRSSDAEMPELRLQLERRLWDDIVGDSDYLVDPHEINVERELRERKPARLTNLASAMAGAATCGLIFASIFPASLLIMVTAVVIGLVGTWFAVEKIDELST